MDSLLLRAALKRGLLIVVANWPIVLIDFAVDVFCQLAIAVPVVGGALMVATVAGIDLELLLSEGVVATADVVVGSLTSRPAALASFLFAVAVVAVAAEVVRFVVKAGTLSVVVTADAVAGEIQRLPLTMHVVRRARAFGLERLVTASRRFVGRAVQLSLWLALAYAVVAICYIALVTWHPPARGSVWLPAWSMLVLAATSTAIVAAAAARFSVTLMRIVIVTDDCSISTAARRLARFVIEDARQVVGVVAAVAGLQVVALGVGLLIAAGIAPLAYLPVVGLLLLPLQAGLWLLRRLVFDALALVGVAACQTQYRRFGAGRWAPVTAGPGTDAAPEAAAGPPGAP